MTRAPAHSFTYSVWTQVTISTVGYGDMSAQTVLGRVAVMCMIIIGVLLFGTQTADLLDLIQSESVGTGRYAALRLQLNASGPRGGGRCVRSGADNAACCRFIHNKGDEFVLICGDLSLHTLREMLRELYHSVCVPVRGCA